MMTLKEINKRIKQADPLVELVRGEGYQYYVFNGFLDVEDHPNGFVDVYETESVMVAYLKHQPAAVWIEDGIAFGKKVRAEFGVA
jgi:hypothetical protein